MAPTISELLIRVFIADGKALAPRRSLKITFVGLARLFWNPSLKFAMY
jgi:hypothetical protein